MGASSSVSKCNIRLKDNTYISYSIGDLNAEYIHNELINAGLNVLQARFMTELNDGLDLFKLSLKEIMGQSKNIIFCISEKTAGSFHQTIEITNALESDKNIIYVFTDKQFTPLNTPYLIGLVSFNFWLPAYDNTTIEKTLEVLESYDL
jgi:hypothetical protein